MRACVCACVCVRARVCSIGVNSTVFFIGSKLIRTGFIKKFPSLDLVMVRTCILCLGRGAALQKSLVEFACASVTSLSGNLSLNNPIPILFKGCTKPFRYMPSKSGYSNSAVSAHVITDGAVRALHGCFFRTFKRSENLPYAPHRIGSSLTEVQSHWLRSGLNFEVFIIIFFLKMFWFKSYILCVL